MRRRAVFLFHGAEKVQARFVPELALLADGLTKSPVCAAFNAFSVRPETLEWVVKNVISRMTRLLMSSTLQRVPRPLRRMQL